MCQLSKCETLSQLDFLEIKPISTTLQFLSSSLIPIFSDTTHDSTDGDYGIEDVRSDQDSDNDDEDETRIPGWAKGLYS